MEDLAQKFKSFPCDATASEGISRHQCEQAGEELDFTRLQQREKTLGHC